MPVIDEILEGEIVEQYRDVAEGAPVIVAGDTDVPGCQTSTGQCTVDGCRESEGSKSGDCCTDDKKKKQQQRAAGWFEPPVAHR